MQSNTNNSSDIAVLLKKISPMEKTLDSRRIDYFEKSNLIVSTIKNNDAEHPYETAISHFNYNQEKFVVVEEYDTPEEAKLGHHLWVKTMTAKKLPSTLIDVGTNEIGKLYKASLGVKEIHYPKEK